jgi:hypothetical protein
MRVLLAVAAAAVVALAWPRREARHVCRSPTARALAARSERQATPDEAVTAVNMGGNSPGVERGGCALRLRLLDDVTGKPFSSDVELWRLDLPEDEEWTAGDHLQATMNVGPDGGTFTDLPAGRYRTVARGQSFLAEDDPPAFLVRGAFTDREFSVRVPQAHRVYLQVFDERGTELRTVGLRFRGRRWCSGNPADPPWARRRRPKRASASLNRPIGVGGGGRSGRRGHYDAPWTEAGFDLGRCREDTRGQRSRIVRSLLVPGHTAVMVDIDGRLTGDRTYVAVSVSLGELEEHVYLPDGRRAADAGALFEANSRAVEMKPSLSPEAWRRLPVKVRVGLAGHEILTFAYQLDHPPAP